MYACTHEQTGAQRQLLFILLKTNDVIHTGHWTLVILKPVKQEWVESNTFSLLQQVELRWRWRNNLYEKMQERCKKALYVFLWDLWSIFVLECMWLMLLNNLKRNNVSLKQTEIPSSLSCLNTLTWALHNQCIYQNIKKYSISIRSRSKCPINNIYLTITVISSSSPPGLQDQLTSALIG